MVGDNEDIDISQRIPFYGYSFDFCLNFSAFEEFVAVVADSDLISVETVSRYEQCETLIDFAGLFLWRSFVVFLKKELISSIDSFDNILNRLGIKISPMCELW